MMQQAAGARTSGSKQSTMPAQVSAFRQQIAELRHARKRELVWGSLVDQMRRIRLEHQRFPQLPNSKRRELLKALAMLLRLLDGVSKWKRPPSAEQAAALLEFAVCARNMQQHYAAQQADP